MQRNASKYFCQNSKNSFQQQQYIRGEYFVYDLNDNTAPNIVARHWGRRSFHYDNCAIAMITLFAVQTSEGWIE